MNSLRAATTEYAKQVKATEKQHINKKRQKEKEKKEATGRGISSKLLAPSAKRARRWLPPSSPSLELPFTCATMMLSEKETLPNHALSSLI